MKNALSDLLGIEIPIIQAPMGYIARAQLASAVSNAGGMGIVETSSGRFDEVKLEVEKMPDLTDKPWGFNVAQLLVRDDEELIDFVLGAEVGFVTTSAGPPARFAPRLRAEGITVFHVVPSLRGAMKALEVGVDGLIVEGVEGGGFVSPYGASTMVLLPLVAAHVDVPVVAAGGISDGRSMAAAFVLGAEGVQMGTRMLSAAESPVHDNWKQAIVDAAESDTLIVSPQAPPAMRVLRTAFSNAVDGEPAASIPSIDRHLDLYFGGEMEASLAFAGQVAGRIDGVEPVADILRRSWEDCRSLLRDIGRRADDG